MIRLKRRLGARKSIQNDITHVRLARIQMRLRDIFPHTRTPHNKHGKAIALCAHLRTILRRCEKFTVPILLASYVETRFHAMHILLCVGPINEMNKCYVVVHVLGIKLIETWLLSIYIIKKL